MPVFWRRYRDDPSGILEFTLLILPSLQNANLSSAPGDARAPWKRIFTSVNLWSFFWMYFASSFGFWFLLTWLPTYLIQRYGISAQRSGFYAALPLAVGAVSNVIGGALSDSLVRRTGSLRWGRRLVGLAGYLMAAAGFTAAAIMQKPFSAILCLMLAEFGIDLAVPVAWAACLEVGENFGTTTAFMNTASSISALISPLAAAWIFTRFGSFAVMLISAGAVYFIASLLWWRVDARKQLLPHRSMQVLPRSTIVGFEFSYEFDQSCDNSLKNGFPFFPSCQRGISTTPLLLKRDHRSM